MLKEEREKLVRHEKMAADLLLLLSSESTPYANNQATVHKTYACKHLRRSRRHVVGAGAQSLSKQLRAFTLADVHDFDISNTMFQLLEQITERLQIEFPHRLEYSSVVPKRRVNYLRKGVCSPYMLLLVLRFIYFFSFMYVPK